MLKRTLVPLLAAALWGVGANAWSLTLGQATSTAVMGQHLQLELPVRTAAGERLLERCITADVMAGDQLLTGAAVPVRLSKLPAGAGWRVQISTAAPITEPVLEVTVGVGCQQRAWQKLVILVSPAEAVDEAIQAHRPVASWKALPKSPPQQSQSLPWAGAAPQATAAAASASRAPAGLKWDTEPTVWSGTAGLAPVAAEWPSLLATKIQAAERAIAALRPAHQKSRAELTALEQHWAEVQSDEAWLLGLSGGVMLFIGLALRLMWRSRPVGLASAPRMIDSTDPTPHDRKEDYYFALGQGQAHAAGGGRSGLMSDPPPPPPPTPAPRVSRAKPHFAATPAVERWFSRA
ncbi:MAG: hypothetical protein U5L74_10790 [Ideonella sp.]|nr:hypothetical protein [Ideonella sp.]